MLHELCDTKIDGLNLSFSGRRDSYQNEKFMRGCRFLEAELQDMDRILSGRYVFLFVLVSAKPQILGWSWITKLITSVEKCFSWFS